VVQVWTRIVGHQASELAVFAKRVDVKSYTEPQSLKSKQQEIARNPDEEDDPQRRNARYYRLGSLMQPRLMRG
jgi:hypothetical protein